VAKQKLKKFADINFFSNVVQPELRHPVNDFHLRGNWSREFFRNDYPIVLEIGCGKGEYTVGLARAYPTVNHIGIDIKGDRIWTGAKQALEEGLYNAAFLRIQAERIAYTFAGGEVSGIWISFPDPQLRESRRKKRLTSPQFLERYKRILRPGSPVHLKTDSRVLFDYTLDVIREGNHRLHFATENLYRGAMPEEPLIQQVRTYYENKFLQQGLPIHYLKFSLGNTQPTMQKTLQTHG
jgi:tRNA (guanine-N7-)-methyltransferase